MTCLRSLRNSVEKRWCVLSLRWRLFDSFVIWELSFSWDTDRSLVFRYVLFYIVLGWRLLNVQRLILFVLEYLSYSILLITMEAVVMLSTCQSFNFRFQICLNYSIRLFFFVKLKLRFTFFRLMNVIIWFFYFNFLKDINWFRVVKICHFTHKVLISLSNADIFLHLLFILFNQML